MKNLGLVAVGFVLGSLIGLSWMSAALFLGAAVVVLKRRELVRALAAMTPPTVWVKEFLPDAPHPEQFSVETADSSDATIGAEIAAIPVCEMARSLRPVVELVGTADKRRRPRRAVLVGLDEGKGQVRVSELIRDASRPPREMTLGLSYVRAAGVVPIR